MSFPYNPDPGRANREAAQRANRYAEDARLADQRRRARAGGGGGSSGCGCLGLLMFLAIVAGAFVLITHNPHILTTIQHHLSSTTSP
jgi:hypothetical protein